MSQAAWDVIVIGAGAAGLAAAADLAESGMRVLILEGRERIGGRIWTRHDTSAGTPIELGAEFVQGLPETTWKLIRSHGLRYAEVPDQHCVSLPPQGDRPAELVGLPHYWEDLLWVLGSPTRFCYDDQPISHRLNRAGKDPLLNRFLPIAKTYIEGYHGADPDDASEEVIRATEQEAGLSDERRVFRLVDGYDQIPKILCDRAKAAGAELHLNSQAFRISWQRGFTEVSARSRVSHGISRHKASAAVIALPLSILQEAVRGGAGLRLSPALIEKTAPLERLRMASVMKIVLRFRDRFWEKIPARGRTVGADLSRITFLHAPTAEGFTTWWTRQPEQWPILVGWTGGPGAARLNRMTEGSVVREALQGLERIFEVSARRLSSWLEESYFHDWQNDSFSHGAYSYVGVGGAIARKQLAHPIQDTLFFAGEATHYEGQSGTVSGAIASGQRVAREIRERSALTRVAG
jgi:monoamine oxidase